MGAIVAFFTNLGAGFSAKAMEIIIVLAILGGVYLYWNHLENEVTTLTTQNTQLQGIVNTQNTTINTLRVDFAKTQQQLDNLNGKFSVITTNTNTESQTFNVGSVTDANKAVVEQQANQSVNSIFTDINNQSLPGSFVGAN